MIQNRFSGYVGFGTDYSSCIVSGRSERSEGGLAGGSCKQLDAKFGFKPGDPTTVGRLGDVKPESSR